MSDKSTPHTPKLYNELASWWPLLSKPSDYIEEAEFAGQTLSNASRARIHSVLELGSGGGNNAFHLKNVFNMTLADLSPKMLEVSRSLNPECEHLQGDMRILRLGRVFDAVFVHDAIMYMTTEHELQEAIETAAAHCRIGGVALFMPDFVRETLVNGVCHGGHDGPGRSLRYMEWTFDPDPADANYLVDFVYLLREGNEPVQVEHDPHLHGIFSRNDWTRLLTGAGFKSRVLEDPYGREVFECQRI